MAAISTIRLRAGTAAAWTSANPTLAASEPGFETDTRKLKIGDGSTAWTSLAYAVGSGGPVTKTADFTIATTENWLINNKSAATCTVTFPAASSWTGRVIYIKTIQAQTVVSASSNIVPLIGGAAGTAILAATAGKWAALQSDGTNWVIMMAA